MDDGSVALTGRILVVDDDPVAIAVLTRILAGQGGFDVSPARDPVTALDLAGTEEFDLVLTDVEMPGMSGLELLAALRKQAPGLPVAVITAHPSMGRAVQALRNHADEFLDKTVRPDQLLTTVTALVASGREARRASHRSVLAVGAHPDDVEIGAGGTLLAHRERGDSVSVLTLSQGSRGGAQSARAAESHRAAQVLGAALYLEDMRDTRISEGDPTIAAISRVVEEVRPAIVYTHSMHDVHQDHRNTYRAAMVAVRGVAGVFCFQSPSATVDFRPTRFVTIDEHLQRKLAAIGAFSSQVDIRAYLEPDMIQSTARYWSRFGACRYAEAFEVVREAAGVGGTPPDAAVTAAGPRSAEIPGAAT